MNPPLATALDVDAPARSRAPDLLFEDVLDARVADLGTLVDDPSTVGAEDALHRVTVFLTYRCNLACPYCKTIARTAEELAARPQKAKTYAFEDFERLLDTHGATRIEHLHFTGGEAVTVRDLARMARRAKERGVVRTSLTSNGTLPPERYLELVDAGIDEIRLSIDAADEAAGERFTARRGAWRRSVRTARALGRARREGADFFLIFNLVVTPGNRRDLPRIARFLLALGADDLKLITEVDRARDLADFPDRERVERELAEVVAALPAERFPLLRRKLGTVFAPDSIGLDRARPVADGTWRCYVPLTERTVDAVNYYPCSVYLREGGAPLGSIDEPQDVQRAKTAAFVARGDCTTDPICARYCLHCTREFNQRANDARRNT